MLGLFSISVIVAEHFSGDARERLCFIKKRSFWASMECGYQNAFLGNVFFFFCLPCLALRLATCDNVEWSGCARGKKGHEKSRR